MFKHCTPRLILAIIAAAVCGSLQQGYNSSCLNAPAKHIIDWTVHLFGGNPGPVNCAILNNVTSNDEQQEPCQQQGSAKPVASNLYYSFLVSIFIFGGMFGSFLSGTFGDIFGRKRALLYNNGLAYIGTTLMFISYDIGYAGYWTFLFGRLVVGFSAGLISGLVPTYLVEISPHSMRGAIAGLNTVFFTTGLFFGAFIGIFLGDCGKWNTIFIFPYLPIAVSIVSLPFCPESPQFFIKIKHQEKNAEHSLRKLRPSAHDIEEELNTLRLDSAKELQLGVTFGQLFRKPYRWPLILCVSMVAAQQFVGVNAVNYYSTKIFKDDAGLGDHESKYATSGLMLVNIISGLVAIWLLDRPGIGRRFLIIVGLAGCCLVMLLLFSLLKMSDCNNHQILSRILAVGLLVVYMILFSIGPSPAIWAVFSESFHAPLRPKAGAITAGANWLFNFTVGIMFNPLRNAVGVYVFLFFVAVGGLFTVFLFLFLAETKGKSVEHLDDEWRTGVVACRTAVRHREPVNGAEMSMQDSLDTMRDVVKF